jgi:hypothetical protein
MANQKLTELSEDATPLDTDITYGVKDPTGSPSSIKWAWSTLKTFLKTYFDTFYQAIGSYEVTTNKETSTASKGGVLRNIDGAVGDVAQTGTGWIEDEKYGFGLVRTATAVSAEFDSAVTRTGRLTLKLSTTDATGNLLVATMGTTGASLGATASKYGIPLKPSTTYRLSCYVKTSAVGSVTLGIHEHNSTGTRLATGSFTTSALTGTNDWVLLTKTGITNASTAFANLILNNPGTGGASDAWFDVNSMTLEEVVTDTTFTGKVAEKIRPVLQAVTSTDNIDQSLDPTGAYTNTYALTNAVNEGATHIQTFTPTKKYTTRIGVWVVEAGTGVDWTLVVHTAGNVVVVSKTIAAASLVEGAMNYFDVPNIWASGALHFHLYASATTGTPTCKANTSNDLETASYIQNYAKKTESFSLIANGIKTQLKADKDGLLSNAIIDLDNGKYNYYRVGNNTLAYADILTDIYEVNTIYASDGPNIGSAGRYVTYKINTILPIKKASIKAVLHGASTRFVDISVSVNNIDWVLLKTQETAAHFFTESLLTNIANKGNIIYVKLAYSSGGASYAEGLVFEADLDTSSIPQGLFYPIGLNQFAETWKATGTVLSYVYRQAKYTNEYGVVMPAIELNSLSNGAGAALGYLPLKIDNSQETTPAITILASSGVASDTVLDADGEYVALSSGATEGSVNYQVTITKNTLYLSSNAESVDSTQDPSHQGNFIIGVRQQGLTDRVKDVGNEIADIKQGVLAMVNSSPKVGYDAGTTDAYEITIPNFTGYYAGMSVIFKANTANTTDATLNINGMGAKAIVKGVSTALSTNDILALMWCQCVYDGTAFVLMNPRAL